jgi:hypothetical protein
MRDVLIIGVLIKKKNSCCGGEFNFFNLYLFIELTHAGSKNMLNFKSIKWCLGVAAALGLTACMDMQRSEQHNGPYYNEMNTQQKQHHAGQNKSKAQQKTYASKDPTQKATPGPTRKAAPQLPVIQ